MKIRIFGYKILLIVKFLHLSYANRAFKPRILAVNLEAINVERHRLYVALSRFTSGLHWEMFLANKILAGAGLA